MSAPHPETSYQVLKEALVALHQLTDFQRVEMLLDKPPLGARRPSELLADMLEICPPGQQGNIFFAGLFLQRLPREIRVLLEHEDLSDLRRLAAHADRLVAFSNSQPHEVAVAAGSEEEMVAAIKQQQKQKGKFQKKKKQPAKAGNPTPSELAAHAAGLCFAHWVYGERARECHAPCNWQGQGN